MAGHTPKPPGSIALPALTCALSGSILAACLEGMSYLDKATAALTTFWQNEPFFLVDGVVIAREWGWVFATVASLAVGYFTLASSALWQRVLVGVMALTVVLGFAPSLVLWGVLWVPFAALFAVLWTWVCALLYAGQHTMPGALVPVPNTPVEESSTIHLKVERVAFPEKKKTNITE